MFPESDQMMSSEMPAEAAVDLLRLFEGAGIDVWLDGGWAVDAALGEQTRSHKDLDIIVQTSDLPRLRKVLGARGVAMKDSGLEVDVHAFVFDETGNGLYRMSNGEDWVFPARGFAGRGQILGLNVRCLSPEVQVLCHAHGYVPKEKDLRDMELLEARFGVELPPHLRRRRESGC
jgi:lincosamide nucleotidyltransferase A/C/D/E